MISQQYHLYTAVETHTWMLLFNRQMQAVKKYAYGNFLQGIYDLNFNAWVIPEFEDVNNRLKALTGWSVYAVPGLIDNNSFFEKIYEKQFAAAIWVREPAKLDYLEEPDMFHDVFGHVPMLTDQGICDYLHGLSHIAKRYIKNEQAIEAIARLYWYTIEFGLIKEGDELKIYGAGILSSISETVYCFSDKPKLLRFNLMKIIDTPYIKDSYQLQYFVLDDIQQLADCLPELENHFDNIYSNQGIKV